MLKILASAMIACKEGTSLRGIHTWARRTFGSALSRVADRVEAWDVDTAALMGESPVGLPVFVYVGLRELSLKPSPALCCGVQLCCRPEQHCWCSDYL